MIIPSCICRLYKIYLFETMSSLSFCSKSKRHEIQLCNVRVRAICTMLHTQYRKLQTAKLSLTVIPPHILTVESTWNSFSHYVIVYITCVISNRTGTRSFESFMVCILDYSIHFTNICQQIYSKFNFKRFV